MKDTFYVEIEAKNPLRSIQCYVAASGLAINCRKHQYSNMDMTVDLFARGVLTNVSGMPVISLKDFDNWLKRLEASLFNNPERERFVKVTLLEILSCKNK